MNKIPVQVVNNSVKAADALEVDYIFSRSGASPVPEDLSTVAMLGLGRMPPDPTCRRRTVPAYCETRRNVCPIFFWLPWTLT